MEEKTKIHWLTRRLTELGKSKRQLALTIHVHPARMNDLENGTWRFQASQIRKAAEFLEFDRTAFLDFISGDLTEEELWNYKKPIEVSEEDYALLKAVKSLATRPTETNATENTAQPIKLQKNDNER